MILLNLPREIWQDVVVSWLGSLREIVRLDCAFCLNDAARKEETVLAACTCAAFSFPSPAEYVSSNVLTELSLWMEARNVYISSVAFSYMTCPSQQWESLFSRSAKTLHSLTVRCECGTSASVVFWAANYLVRLQRLEVIGSAYCVPGNIEEIMQNNASTLAVLVLDGCASDLNMDQLDVPLFPSLQVLHWVYAEGDSSLCALLRMCPHLTALHVSGDRRGGDCRELLRAIAQSCPLLQRLRLDELSGVNDFLMMQVALRCPQIEYLGFWECEYPATAEFGATVVRALPKLQTLLVSDTLTEEMEVAIAASRASSLRILCGARYA